MNSLQKTIVRAWCITALFGAMACGGSPGVDDSANAVIDPPQQCSVDRPDCSISSDFPVQADLNPTNSSGLRYSPDTGTLVIDRVSSLPDEDFDGVPDDADDCLGMPGWRLPCDGDPTNDGIYQTLFFDSSGTQQTIRTSIATTTVDIPAIDIYFLVDGTFSMAEEIGVLQSEIANVISDIQLSFSDAQLGLGLYREYPVDMLEVLFSQAPYHHILDLTDDTTLFAKAVSTLDTVLSMPNDPDPDAGSQALYSVASGQGLGDFVPNRAGCPVGTIGYPCFRPDVLRVVLNVSDAEMYNGPRPASPLYPAFGSPSAALPPVQMFPALLDADDALTALDLGDLSAQSLTLMGMSNLLNDQVNTAIAPGCETMSGVPPGMDMDDKDVVIAFRFDAPPAAPVEVSANNTHWPGANVALFDNALLDPTMALGCDGAVATSSWGGLQWPPIAAQQYYIVIDGQLPAADPMVEPEGAFSLSIRHEGDPSNPTWDTIAAPVDWAPVEVALLANNIRVASVVSPKDAMTMPSDADADARQVAVATRAVTKVGGQWVGEITSPDGEGLGAQVTNTINLILDESVYEIRMIATDNDASPGFDETDFVVELRTQDCAQGEVFECGSSTTTRCQSCEPGADVDFELLLLNSSVIPTASAQVFDFEIIVRADNAVEVDRIPVRVMVPDDATHAFEAAPGANFYRNSYDSFDLDRCEAPSQRPDWGYLTWEGSTPGDSTIEFQIRAANTAAELDIVVPAVVVIPTDTTETTLDIGQELINDGIPNGLPFVRVTAMLNPSADLLATPELRGWTLEFVCFDAD